MPLGFSTLCIAVGLLICIRYGCLGISLVILGVSVLLVFSSSATAYWLVRYLEDKHPAVALAKVELADYIVVLGGAEVDVAHAPRLEVELTEQSDRLHHAVRLYRAGKAAKILHAAGNPLHLFGLNDSAYTSGSKILLMEWGVEPASIIQENNSRTTRENAVAVLSMLPDDSARLLLVTSALHMPRAMKTFKALGLNVVAMPTDFQTVGQFRFNRSNWLPSAGALSMSTSALHEYLGLWFYQYKGWAL